MKYGLIGEKLGHSHSKTIHEALGRYDYELMPMPPEAVGGFMTDRNFDGINVTIPYKQTVMDYLDYIDEKADSIGAVNTVVNKNGKLYGYNTDHPGMTSALLRAGFDLKGKTVLILGTGGTSKTAFSVCRDLLAADIFTVSRTPAKDQISYKQAEEVRADYIINTTPVGMFPNNGYAPLELSRCGNLSGVFDVIYNPLRTKLALDAKKLGVPCETGLYMLVAQAVFSAELFLDTKLPSKETERIYKELLSQLRGMVFVGMPGSGKSSVGALAAELLGREFIDTDDILTKKLGNIADYINKHGEDAFRDEEELAVQTAVSHNGAVIATGGGAVLREKNREKLCENATVFYLKRSLSRIIPDGSRPLSSDREKLAQRYRERKDIYSSVCDATVMCNGTVEAAARRAVEKYKKSK